MAALVLASNNSSDEQVMCGGTLVNEDTVITAAHCFDPIPGGAGINMARLGDHDITTTADGASPTDISIARSAEHLLSLSTYYLTTHYLQVYPAPWLGLQLAGQRHRDSEAVQAGLLLPQHQASLPPRPVRGPGADIPSYKYNN